jgi:hypothetical protein
VGLQNRGGVLGPGINHDIGTEVLGELQLLISDIDGRDGTAEDLGVLQRQVAQPTDAGYSH